MLKLKRRTRARVIAIQALYAYHFSQQEQLPNDIIAAQRRTEDENNVKHNADELSIFLIDNTLKYYDSLDEMISQHISESWCVERLEKIILMILRVAVCEIMHTKNTPTNVIINEYTTITAHFADPQEIDFVNAILEKISKYVANQISE